MTLPKNYAKGVVANPRHPFVSPKNQNLTLITE